MPDKPICLISFPTKFAGAEQVPCDLKCGTLCYEHSENIVKARASNGHVICVFCAIEMNIHLPNHELWLQGQLWHGEQREPEVVGDVNQLLMDLLNKKDWTGKNR